MHPVQTDSLHVYTQKYCARLFTDSCALLITDYKHANKL